MHFVLPLVEDPRHRVDVGFGRNIPGVEPVVSPTLETAIQAVTLRTKRTVE